MHGKYKIERQRQALPLQNAHLGEISLYHGQGLHLMNYQEYTMDRGYS